MKQHGWVERCADGVTGLVRTLKWNPDLIIVSGTIPKLAGAELCGQIRSSSSAIILVLPGKSSEDERMVYYENGADEVVAAELGTREITWKASVLLRRCSLQPAIDLESAHVKQFGPLSMNDRTHRTYVDGTEIHLTRKEFAILWILISNPSRMISRDELIRSVWRYESLGDDRMIDTHLNRIRKKLSLYSHWFTIKTIWGVGYKLESVKTSPNAPVRSLM
jgi:DNA-binding response OmpR family regulator